MNRRHIAKFALIFAVALGSPVWAAKAPESWDGLVRVKSKRLSYVYLAPGADFRGYTKVMLDPTEVAFHKDWVRDYNSNVRDPGGRVSDSDVKKVIDQSAPVATEIFTKQFAAGGYPVVAAPGPDVLRVRTALLNVSVTAPDVRTAGRSRSYAGEAGGATLVVEARDSQTGALLGRAVDSRLAGDNNALLRNSVTNRSDFRSLATSWAKTSVNGLNTLKEISPIDDTGATKAK